MDSGTQVLNRISPKELITPRRLDLAVKWRFFMDMLPGPKAPWAEGTYRWHIAERMTANAEQGIGMDANKTRSIDEYVDKARDLFRSMRGGFDHAYPVPIDPAGELLDGAHRTACALALGHDVAVVHLDRKAWAPAWDEDWFISRAPASVVAWVKRDWDEMCRSS